MRAHSFGWEEPVLRATVMVLSLFVVAACGGGTAPTATSRAPTSAPSQAASSGAPATSVPGGLPTAAELCALLTAQDWGTFNYVTAAQPDVQSDAPGSAICTYANGLFLEAYVDETPADAEETFQTIVDNAPFNGNTSVAIPGTDEVQYDEEISPGKAGIAVRTGRVSFTIGLPAGDAAQAQLTALAAIVLQRVSNLS